MGSTTTRDEEEKIHRSTIMPVFRSRAATVASEDTKAEAASDLGT